jgi:membrane-associated phospholipid phosphatase
MHWLLSIDIALFHFINTTLANPFFDWLMPLLSGNGVPWLGAVILAVPLILYFGSARLRLCALLMVLAVALGDPLVVGTVKKSVERPRPFVTQPDARLFGEAGKGYVAPLPDGSLPANANRRSFPSAHAANWFALATVAFLFYRRSARFLFPLAAAVAFSRIYNGVHYPSDVTVGAILGAGYALALMILAQMLWNFLGKRIFPAWHEKLPVLLQPETGIQTAKSSAPETGNRPSETEWLRLGYIVILVALVARWIYIHSGMISLSEDEAYQWLWSKHLALSYYSKPLGIAYIQWAGTKLFGDTDLGVRFFSPVFAAILSWLILRFLAREIGARNAFVLLLATLAMPLLVVGALLMTIDPPLVLCWMWAVIAAWRAVQPDGRTRDWLVVGLATGLAFLCKQSAIFLPVCLGIYFALQPSARVHLRRPGPWLALGILAVCALPYVIWNAQHGWVNFHHLANNAGLDSTWHPTLRYFFEFFGAELGLLNPVFFIAMLWATFAFWNRRREKPLMLFLFCMGGPLFFGYWLYSLHSRILPNWIASAVPPLFCLAALFWAERPKNLKPWLTAGMILGLLVSAIMYDSDLLGKFIGKLPGDKDPTHRLRGGREAALLVEKERARFDPGAFIIADHYGSTGLFSFYSPAARAAANSSTPLVYSIDANAPVNQMYFWDAYNYRAHRRGQNAIYAMLLDPYPLEPGWFWKWLRREPVQPGPIPPPRPVPPRIAEEFESVTNLGIREVKLKDGRVFQRVELFGCYHLK